MDKVKHTHTQLSLEVGYLAAAGGFSTLTGITVVPISTALTNSGH